MPCKFQGTFDLHMTQPRQRQSSFVLRPRGVSIWSQVRPAEYELVHDAFNDLMQNGDLADECDIVVPVVGGHATPYAGGIDAGAGIYAVPDVTHANFAELLPVASNGVFQKLVGDIVKSARKCAAKEGFDPRRLPQDERQAKRMGVPDKHILPAWMTDTKLLVAIEKRVREDAFEKLPDLRDLHHGEEECGRVATQLFLETGWNPISSSLDTPRSVRESSELSRLYSLFKRAQDKLTAPSPRELAGVGLLSDWIVNNGDETTCTYTAPWISAQGFDSVPSLGMNGEDLDDVQDIITARLRGESFDHILDPNFDRYGFGRDRKPKQIHEVANRIWQRMVERDGVHAGMLRPSMPRREVKGAYLQQPNRAPQVTPPGGAYQVLGSGLVVPV